jgi:electron transfer flavoprotein alpha/beta subunit
MCKFFRTSVLNFAGLFKALESSDIFAQNVEFDIHYRSHFDVAEVGILSGIRNDGNGKCVVCRITDGERNAVNGNAALIDGGVETVEAPLPLVITVNGSAAPCRPCNVKLVMKYKYATCPMERKGDEPWANLYEERPYLTLNQWSVADVDGDPAQCGLSGSPTKVKAVKNIVFQAKESKTLTSSDEDIDGLMKELLNESIIG